MNKLKNDAGCNEKIGPYLSKLHWRESGYFRK